MDAAIEDALVSWFQAAQAARSASWTKQQDEHRRADFARVMLRLTLAADQLYDAVDHATGGQAESLPRLVKSLRARRAAQQ